MGSFYFPKALRNAHWRSTHAGHDEPLTYLVSTRIPESETTSALSELVEHLLHKWEDETRHVSSPSIAMRHEAYRKLLALGDEAIEPLLQIYRHREGFAFMVLAGLTGINPVPPKLQGNVVAAKKAWMSWWAEKNEPARPSPFQLRFPTTHTDQVDRYQPVFG